MKRTEKLTFLTFAALLLCGFSGPTGFNGNMVDPDGDNLISNKEFDNITLTLSDYTMVVDTRFTDSHLIFRSSDHVALIGVEFEGSTYLTIDGKDYRDPVAFEALKLPQTVRLFGNVWLDNFGYPFDIGPQKECGFWERWKDTITHGGKCERDG